MQLIRLSTFDVVPEILEYGRYLALPSQKAITMISWRIIFASMQPKMLILETQNLWYYQGSIALNCVTPICHRVDLTLKTRNLQLYNPTPLTICTYFVTTFNIYNVFKTLIHINYPTDNSRRLYALTIGQKAIEYMNTSQVVFKNHYTWTSRAGNTCISVEHIARTLPHTY